MTGVCTTIIHTLTDKTRIALTGIKYYSTVFIGKDYKLVDITQLLNYDPAGNQSVPPIDHVGRYCF